MTWSCYHRFLLSRRDLSKPDLLYILAGLVNLSRQKSIRGLVDVLSYVHACNRPSTSLTYAHLQETTSTRGSYVQCSIYDV